MYPVSESGRGAGGTGPSRSPAAGPTEPEAPPVGEATLLPPPDDQRSRGLDDRRDRLGMDPLAWTRLASRLDFSVRPAPATWELLLETSGEALILASSQGRIVLASKGASALFGLSRRALVGHPLDVLVPPRLQSFFPPVLSEVRNRRGPALTAELRRPFVGQRSQGEEFAAEASIAWVPTVDDGVFFFVIRDVSERLRWQRASACLDRIIEDSADELYVFDLNGWTFRQVNGAARENLGYQPEDFAQLTLLDIQPAFTPRSFAALIQPLVDGKTDRVSYESIQQRRNGSTYEVSVRLVRLPEEQPPLAIAYVRDVTENRRNEAIIQRQNQYDTVTMLPNRLAFLHRTEQAVRDADQDGQKGAVIVVGLGQTQLIQDGLGALAGEDLAQQVAQRLTEAVTGHHLVARIGEAEFAVLAPRVPDRKAAEAIARSLLNNLAKPLQTGDVSVVLPGRAGVAVFPDHGNTADELLRQAHGAMLLARSEDQNALQSATKGLNRTIRDRIRLESALGRALERNEFSLVFQPTIDVGTRAVSSVEALLRWNPRAGEAVGPDVFVPILEETGLIEPVGQWVLDTALAEARSLKQEGFPDLRVAINLSMRQITAQLPDRLADGLHRAGLPGEAVLLELTETSLMRNVDESLAILNRLSGLGIGLAIDDFGCGYSSLSYLRQLPLTTLKIDRSFVRDMGTNPDAAAIASTIVAMAKALRLRTVAEGVETAQQLRLLAELGCDEVQGFHFFKPMSRDTLRQALAGDISQKWKD